MKTVLLIILFIIQIRPVDNLAQSEKTDILNNKWLESPVLIYFGPDVSVYYRRTFKNPDVMGIKIKGLQGVEWTVTNKTPMKLEVRFTKIYNHNINRNGSVIIGPYETMKGGRWIGDDITLWDDLFDPKDLGSSGGNIQSVDIENLIVKNLDPILKELEMNQKREDWYTLLRLKKSKEYVLQDQLDLHEFVRKVIVEDSLETIKKQEIQKKLDEASKLENEKKIEESKKKQDLTIQKKKYENNDESKIDENSLVFIYIRSTGDCEGIAKEVQNILIKKGFVVERNAMLNTMSSSDGYLMTIGYHRNSAYLSNIISIVSNIVSLNNIGLLKDDAYDPYNHRHDSEYAKYKALYEIRLRKLTDSR